MKTLLKLSSTTAFIAGISSTVLAHHSNAPHFDTSVDITVEAVVTEWKFVNPHAYIYFDAPSSTGTGEIVNWRCESSASAALRKRGFTDQTFVPGQKLTINGNPARREDDVCFMTSFAFEDGTEVGGRDSLPEDKIVGAASEPEIVDQAPREKYLANGQPNISGYWVGARRGPGGATGRDGGGRPGADRTAGGPPQNAQGGERPQRQGGGGGRGPAAELTEAGLAVQESYEQIYDDPSIHCDISSIFFGLTHDQHVNEIIQEDDKVILRYGYMDYVRTIFLDMDEHPEHIEPSRGGHSIGMWEDDVLVVDTVGFSAGYLFPLSGLPYSDQMHSVERFWVDEETQILHQSYIANDPLYLAAPFSGQSTLAMSNIPYEPYNCTELSGDNNRRPADRTGD